jgi:hypothetical protein
MSRLCYASVKALGIQNANDTDASTCIAVAGDGSSRDFLHAGVSCLALDALGEY